jgi:hypothetical protein
MLSISPKNARRETLFEKELVKLDQSCTWANQIPTSSGLMKGYRDKKRNIDLGHRVDASWFELIELKITDKTPLYAAFQILTYGLLYLFYKENFSVKPHNVLLLGAAKIELKVVAPEEYYQDYRLRWLESCLDDGIRKHCTGRTTQMSFSFERFVGYWGQKDPHLLAPLFMSRRRPLYGAGILPENL